MYKLEVSFLIQYSQYRCCHSKHHLSFRHLNCLKSPMESQYKRMRNRLVTISRRDLMCDSAYSVENLSQSDFAPCESLVFHGRMKSRWKFFRVHGQTTPGFFLCACVNRERERTFAAGKKINRKKKNMRQVGQVGARALTQSTVIVTRRGGPKLTK